MINHKQFFALSLDKKINLLYEHGTFIMSIRYYRHKVNLYLYDGKYVEVFVNHKDTAIERIAPLDEGHSRMKFYSDQIKLPNDVVK